MRAVLCAALVQAETETHSGTSLAMTLVADEGAKPSPRPTCRRQASIDSLCNKLLPQHFMSIHISHSESYESAYTSHGVEDN